MIDVVESLNRKQVFVQFLMVFGGLVALIAGFATALIPRLAWISICQNIFEGTWSVGYHSLSPQFHDLTLGILISVFGSVLVLLVFINHNNKLVPLSLTGNILGFLGILLLSGDRAFVSFPFWSCFRMTWSGIFLTLVGVMLLLVGSFFLYDLKGRWTLFGLPLLLMFFSIRMIIVITNNFPHFSVIQSNVVLSLTLAIFWVLGGCLPILGCLINFRFPTSDLSETRLSKMNRSTSLTSLFLTVFPAFSVKTTELRMTDSKLIGK